MTRRPFASLLVVATLGTALAAALLLASLPPPLRALMRRCAESGSICSGLLRIGHAASEPCLLALLLWSLCRGALSGWSHWRQTRRAIERLRARGIHAPTGHLRAVCAELGLAGKVAVVETGTPLALCWGIRRPRIWISAGMVDVLSAEEIAAVLRHEREHLIRRHPLQLLLARALAAALPLLPVVRELADTLPRAQELAADRGVIRAGGRHALGRALLALVDAQRPAPPLPLAPGIAGVLDARLDQLTGAGAVPARLSRRALIATALTFGAGALLLWLSTLGMGPAQVLLRVQHLGALRIPDPWRCLGAPAVIGAAALQAPAALAHVRRWITR